MMNLHTTELLINFITFFIAYLVVATSTNVFRAWVAEKMGDDTGAYLGFLTFNPLFHIDPIGLMCLFIFYFGWGRVVPINPLNIYGSYRSLRLAVVYLSDTVIHLVMSVLGIIALLAIFDRNIISVVASMVLTYNVSELYIVNMYPDLSSLVVSVGFIIFAFVYLNVVLGVLHFIIDFSNYLLFILSDYYDIVARYAYYITIGLPIFLILFFSYTLRLFAVYFISYVGFFIAHMLGIA